MPFKRTGKTQTELTKTGVITTAEEFDRKKGRTRWVQIGYTSIVERTDDETGKKKKFLDGPVGKALLNVINNS